MRKSGTRVATIFISVFLSFFVASLVFSSALHAQSPFYQGKSINLIVGNQAGGLYDLWARLIANHIAKQNSKTDPRQPQRQRAEHACSWLIGCGKLSVQRCQT